VYPFVGDSWEGKVVHQAYSDWGFLEIADVVVVVVVVDFDT
jgi:hypothetical protein